jgi:hypothetical protein
MWCPLFKFSYGLTQRWLQKIDNKANQIVSKKREGTARGHLASNSNFVYISSEAWHINLSRHDERNNFGLPPTSRIAN